ncbi:MAG: XdhC family protein [Gammaproteobacteria bacterium]|nr:XdhC family protein [Gammaproteobacteria bacterium]
MTDVIATEIAFLQTLCNWLKNHHRVILATVISTSGHTPRRPGAQFALRDDGQFIGSVSGGCAEDDLITSLLNNFPDQPMTICFGGDQDDARAALACGGEIELAIEPLTDRYELETILDALQSGQRISRSYHVNNGNSLLLEQPTHTGCTYKTPWLTVSYGSLWRMFIIGAVDIAYCLIPITQMLGYSIHVCDPRQTYRQTWRNNKINVNDQYPDDWLNNNTVDCHSAIVALTHDPRIDDMGLMVALNSDAFYIGALGSKRSTDKRRTRLAQLELTTKQINRLHGPIGLDIGSRSAAEIAVSIAAQLVNVQTRLEHPKP